MNNRLADLHCHILPHMDDGAENTAMAMEMLMCQLKNGVDQVALTPHFLPWQENAEHFARRRQKAYLHLEQAIREERLPIDIKLGAEIYYTPDIAERSLSYLALEGTRYLLIELSTEDCPEGIEETIIRLCRRGYRPIIAHVERYPYVIRNPILLYQWVKLGALAQINGSCLIRGGSLALKVESLLKCHLIHLLCSDAHSMEWRRPNLREAYSYLAPAAAQWFSHNAKSVFRGRELSLPEPIVPKVTV